MTPTHAILLTGKSAAVEAAKRAHDLLGTHTEYLMHIKPDGKGTIPIEKIRELTSFMSLKVPGRAAVRRVVIIEDADNMGHDAQNALLKTLEEPPQDTVVLLTTEQPQNLLPTIRSRTQIEHLSSTQLPPENEAVQLVKQALSGTTYDRLLLVDSALKDRSAASAFTQTLVTVAEASLHQAAQKDAKTERWQQVLAASFEASEALAKSANVRLTLTELMLSF